MTEACRLLAARMSRLQCAAGGKLSIAKRVDSPSQSLLCFGQLDRQLPQLGLYLAGVPDRVERAQVDPRDRRLVGVRHAFPAIVTRAVDECGVVRAHARLP